MSCQVASHLITSRAAASASAVPRVASPYCEALAASTGFAQGRAAGDLARQRVSRDAPRSRTRGLVQEGHHPVRRPRAEPRAGLNARGPRSERDQRVEAPRLAQRALERQHQHGCAQQEREVTADPRLDREHGWYGPQDDADREKARRAAGLLGAFGGGSASAGAPRDGHRGEKHYARDGRAYDQPRDEVIATVWGELVPRHERW